MFCNQCLKIFLLKCNIFHGFTKPSWFVQNKVSMTYLYENENACLKWKIWPLVVTLNKRFHCQILYYIGCGFIYIGISFQIWIIIYIGVSFQTWITYLVSARWFRRSAVWTFLSPFFSIPWISNIVQFSWNCVTLEDL